MIEKIKKELFELKEDKYKEFSNSLLPNIDNILGVRLPTLRKIAKRLAKSESEKYFLENDDEFFELTMLEGMLIGLAEDDFSLTLKRLEKFIPKINNWSICDTTVASLKSIKKNKKTVKDFLQKYLKSDKEFEIRFAFVVLLNYFIDEDFDFVMQEIIKFKSEKYYAKMAAAWALSYCFVCDFDKTLKIIKQNKIQNWVLKKGIQKAKESFKISKEQKELLKTYKIL